MPDSADDTNAPRPDRHTATSEEALVAGHGPYYTTIIKAAAGMRFFLTASDDQLDPHNTAHIEHRMQSLWQLKGMQSAAAHLLGMHGQPLEAANEVAEMHIISMAAAMEQDAKDRYDAS